MKPTNQRSRTVEALKFLGIFACSLLIMSFVFISQSGISQQEDELMLAEIDSLQAQISIYESREKMLANTLYYADSTLGLMQKLGDLEDQIISLKRQGLEGDFGLISLEGEIQAEQRSIQGALIQLGRAQNENISNVPLRNIDLVRGYREQLVETYKLLLREKEFKRVAVLGKQQNQSDEDDLAEMQRLVEAQKEQLEKQQLENQYTGQIDKLSMEKAGCDTRLAATQNTLQVAKNNLANLQNTISNSKQIVATQAPSILTHSRDLISYTSNLDGIVSRIKGIGDRQDREQLEKLIKSYQQVAKALEANASQLNLLNAQL